MRFFLIYIDGKNLLKAVSMLFWGTLFLWGGNLAKSQKNGDALFELLKEKREIGDWDSVIVYSDMARVAFRSEGNMELEAEMFRQKGLAYSKTMEYEKAGIELDSALALASQLPQMNVGNICLYYSNAVGLRVFGGNHSKGLKLCYEALQFFEDSFEAGKIPQSRMINFLHTTGGVLAEIGFDKKAIPMYFRALRIAKMTSTEFSRDIGFVYQKLSQSYRRRQNYPMAFHCNREAFRIFQKLDSDSEKANLYKRELRGIQNDLALIYGLSGNPKIERELLRKVISERKGDIPSSNVLVGLSANWNNLGRSHGLSGNLDSASHYLEKSLEVRENILGNSHSRVSNVLTNLALVAGIRGDYPQQLDYAKRAYAIRVENSGVKGVFVAKSLLEQGQAYLSLGQGKLAIQALEEGLSSLMLSSPEGFTGLPQDFSSIIDKGVFKDICFQLHQAYRARSHKGQNIQDLKVSMKFIEFACRLVGVIDYEGLESGIASYSRDNIWQRNSFVFESGVSMAGLLAIETGQRSYLQKGLMIADECKGRAFREKAFYDDLTGESSGFLLKLEAQIKNRLGVLYEKQWALGTEDDGQSNLSQEIIELETKRYQIFEDLEEKEAGVYQKQGLPFSSKFEEVYSILFSKDPDRVVLEYFEGSETMYIFCLSKDDLSLSQFPLTPGSRSAIDLATQFCTSKSLPEEKSRTEYEQALWNSYQLLIPNRAKGKRLLVIPDGLLSHLPFSALLTSKVSVKYPSYAANKLPFLIKESAIGYGVSLGEQAFWKTSSNQEVGSIHFFSPENEISVKDTKGEIMNYPRLPFSNPCTTLKENLNIKYFRGPDGTEEALSRSLSQSVILHVSAHGVSNKSSSNYSFLALYRSKVNDGFLHTYELYGLDNMKARLAVLSACHSGGGEYRNGNGVLSIARGIHLAGVPTVLSSKWLANSGTTTALLNRFYENLGRGLPVDIALQRATVSFLKKEGGDGVGGYPHYWAHLQAEGDMAPVIN